MNALLRAKFEWELVNAQRLYNLFLIAKAGAGLSLYLLWAAARFLVLTVFGQESFINDRFPELQNAKRFF